jgi:hypothetical protein
LIGSVAPRPIAFISTVNTEGVANLAPYSFFNAFSANPPIVVFSASLRGSNAAKEDILSIKNDMRVQKTVFSADRKQALHLLAQEAFLKRDTDLGIKTALLSDFI